MKIAIGCDHGGWKLKEKIKEFLDYDGYDFEDYGTYNADSCDYPDYALPAAEAVARGEKEKGILICTTGIGMSICANKVPGVRAALCNDEVTARLSREHNNSNILVMGANSVSEEKVRSILRIWLKTEFLGGRHARRVDKVKNIEEKYCKSSLMG